MGGKDRVARAPFQPNPNPPAGNDTLFAPKILLFYKKTEKDNKALARSVNDTSAELKELREQLTEQDDLKERLEERLAEQERLMTELVAKQTGIERKVSDQSSLMKTQTQELNAKIEILDLKTR